MRSIRSLLVDDERTRAWVESLATSGEPDFDVALPAIEDLPAVLLELAVPHEDINELLTTLPELQRDAEAWWLLRRCAHALVQHLGKVDGPPRFPPLPASLGASYRYFYVYVFLAVLEYVRAFHLAHGVPADVSRRTLADLGRNMAVHRRRHGTGGLDLAYWLMLHFRGAIYQLGRLQFQRARLGRCTGTAIRETGLPLGPDDPVLEVHIPEFYGPLSPPACDRSLAQAKAFFAEHFPGENYRVAACHSWLLDDQLADYLPARSNIVAFQHRFRPVPRPAYRPQPDDESILLFVFGRTTGSLEELPRRTTLQRAIVDHLLAGRHWYVRSGWLTL